MLDKISSAYYVDYPYILVIVKILILILEIVKIIV